jgi:tetratricopeptide (TPR) repeat protein
MSDMNPPPTEEAHAADILSWRLRSAWLAWRGGKPTPRWQDYLPPPGGKDDAEWIFRLVQADIEGRIDAELPALLSERYFEHSRWKHDDSRLNTVRQVELIHWEYQQRWRSGERARRGDYQAAFPQHASALSDLKPTFACPRCGQTITLEETAQALGCPVCDSVTPATTPPPHAGTEGRTPSSPLPGLDLRGYELIERLGGGGMGDVYRAGDPALGRDLAVKVMKAELQGHSLAEQRFLREARVTGSLQHPSIVPIYNLGRLADGRLHYTMRLVRGRTLADIFKEEAGKPERLPALLTIFEKVCQAVAYAHSKQVIHRDLKPANFMVGRFGEVQVMDWGLAKLLCSGEHDCVSDPRETEEVGTRIHTEAGETPVELTRLGREMGTPAYMPPEQALGEWDMVDERADVFALGAILCAILTGRPPYNGRDGEEVLRKAKRGDLAEALTQLDGCGADTPLVQLCRDCLAAARESRPRDAEQVAQRVAGYQAEVQERLRRAELERTAAVIQAREEHKRRRWMLAALLLLLAGVAASTGLAVWAWTAAQAERMAKQQAEIAAEAERVAREAEVEQREKAEEQKWRAEDNAQKAANSEADTKAVLEYFQEKVLSAGRPKDQDGGLGKDVKLRQAVDAAEPTIAKAFADRPLVEASIRYTLGVTYRYLGDYPEAIQQIGRALALYEAKLGADHLEALEARNTLAIAYRQAGRTADAIRLHEQNLPLREVKLGVDHAETLSSRSNLAVAYLAVGRTDDAIRLHEQTLKQREAKLGAEHPDTLMSRNNLAKAYRVAGRTADAIRSHQENLKLYEAKLGPVHPNTLMSRGNLAAAYMVAGRYADAIRLHEQGLKQEEAILGENHPSTLTSRSNLGIAYLKAGRTTEAIRLLEQTLKQREAKLGDDHPDTLASRNNLATAYQQAGRFAEAIQLFEQALKQQEARRGPEHPDTLLYRNNLAATYLSAGRADDAIRLHEPNLKLQEKKLGLDHPTTLSARNNLAKAYQSAGRTAEAIQLFEQTLRQREAKLGRNHPDTLTTMVNLGVAYRDTGRLQDAISQFETVLERGRRRSDGLPAALAALPGTLAQTYEQAGQNAEAEALYRDLLEQAQKRFSSDDPRTASALSQLGGNLLKQKKHPEAEPLLRQCLAIRDKKQPDEWNTFNTRSVLGEALFGQKKYAEAEPLLVQGCQGMKQRQDKIPSANRQLLLNEARERLVQLYEAIGKKEEAAKWRNR